MSNQNNRGHIIQATPRDALTKAMTFERYDGLGRMYLQFSSKAEMEVVATGLRKQIHEFNSFVDKYAYDNTKSGLAFERDLNPINVIGIDIRPNEEGKGEGSYLKLTTTPISGIESYTLA